MTRDELKRLTITEARPHLDAVIHSFPETFALRAWPGERFRISPEKTYVNDDGDITLVVQIWQGDGGRAGQAQEQGDEDKRSTRDQPEHGSLSSGRGE